MLRCLIVDDEEMSRRAVEALARNSGMLEVVKVCSDPLDAIEALRNGKIDLMFVDVEMPEMTGFELIRSLQSPPEIILITAREKYAVDAFEIQVADYLVKPVALPRFVKAVNRVAERLEADRDVESTTDSLFVKANSQLINVKLTDLQWVEATGDYVTLNTPVNKYIVHSTMKGIERKLPSNDFVRVHRSYIVRIDKIKAIEETLIIIGKNLIPISDSYRSALMKRLNMV